MRSKIVLSLLFSTWCVLLHAQLPSVQEVYQIFQAKCVSCHGGTAPAGGLDLIGTGATELARAVNVGQKLRNINPSNTFALAKGYKRVVPGRPDRSFLFRKINQGFEPIVPALEANEGDVMPGSYPNTALTDLEKEIIRQWILYGAGTSGVLFDKSVVESFYNSGGDKSFPAGPPPAPAPSEGFQIKMGPFYLAPGGEVEYYQKYALSLPANVEVDRLDMKISPYSHHFLLYNFTGTTPGSGIPDGFRVNSYHNDINLVAAIQEQTDLVLPQGTAFKWDKNIILDYDSHYINYSLSKPYQCEVYVNVYTNPVGTAQQEMFATLLVNPNISIPNNGNTIVQTKPEYQFGADSIYIWGLMGHTHKYGVGYKVWKRLSNGQKGELIYDASCPFGIPGCPAPQYDYQHIPLHYWSPLLPIKWSQGIIHEGTWVNNGPAPVVFGPTSDDEMMVLIAFYTLQPLAVGVHDPLDDRLYGVDIAPNPATGTVRITAGNQETVELLRIFDVAGREVMRRTEVPGLDYSLDISNLQPGLYFVDADGRKGKLIVE